jgi:ADP-ribose pyrophosphatase
VSRQIVFRGRKIQVALDTTRLRSGETIQRDIILHPGAVAILPVVDSERICLVRNRRPIVGKVLIEIPAGTLEPGEKPAAAARRELAEETGYRARRWQKLVQFIPSPGVLSERTHVFVARDLTPGPQQLEKDEHIKPLIVSWQQAVAWAVDGTIEDAKTLIAILLWERLRKGKKAPPRQGR